MAAEPDGPWSYTPLESRTRLAPKRWQAASTKRQFFPGHGQRRTTKTKKKQEVDYGTVRSFIKTMLERPGWDDGNIGPLLIRLAFNASASYDGERHGTDAQGGICGAGMRFESESEDLENTGLQYALDMIAPVKDKWPDLSHSDLWVLAAYAAIESMGGPEIEFVPGRLDFEAGHQTYMAKTGGASRLPKAEFGTRYGEDRRGRITGWEKTAEHLREVFSGRLGFTDREIVALLGGYHSFGRSKWTGYTGRWTKTPTAFNNEYFRNLLNLNYKMISKKSHGLSTGMRPAEGCRQYVSDGGKGKLAMQVADMVLVWDREFVKLVKKYGRAPKTFSRDFGRAFKRLTELGFTQSCDRGDMDEAPRDSLLSPRAMAAWVRPEDQGRGHMRR